jgi:hypothetical protein
MCPINHIFSLSIGGLLMDEEKSKLLEAADKGVKTNYLMAKALLKKHFRTLYENAGMEWTRENDNEIEFIVEAIKNKAVLQAIKTVNDTVDSGEPK